MSIENKKLYLKRIITPIKEAIIGATDKGLCLLMFSNEESLNNIILKIAKELNCSIKWSENSIIRQTEQQLKEYFAGERTEFTIPLQLVGTDFQKQVWQTLYKIPYGETWSYKQEAEFLGNPKACRAVANANGANPICIIVPCHRVIGSPKITASHKTPNINPGYKPNLGGYSAGLWRKEFLLNLEQNLI